MKHAQKWQEEIDYCATLIETRGNANVGGSANVAPYLDCQFAGATRDSLPNLASLFKTAAEHVRRGNWGWALSQMQKGQ